MTVKELKDYIKFIEDCGMNLEEMRIWCASSVENNSIQKVEIDDEWDMILIYE